MTTVHDLIGKRWSGVCELWEDPLGDVVQRSECTITVRDDALHYTWSYKDTPHQGQLSVRSPFEYTDSWHQQEKIACDEVQSSPRSLLRLQYTYMETWGWRMNLCMRQATSELVLQMTNIAPWGEEARAVRMICKQTS